VSFNTKNIKSLLDTWMLLCSDSERSVFERFDSNQHLDISIDPDDLHCFLIVTHRAELSIALPA
jgi:hypothetical protein